jgi:hypothetical protein
MVEGTRVAVKKASLVLSESSGYGRLVGSFE